MYIVRQFVSVCTLLCPCHRDECNNINAIKRVFFWSFNGGYVACKCVCLLSSLVVLVLDWGTQVYANVWNYGASMVALCWVARVFASLSPLLMSSICECGLVMGVNSFEFFIVESILCWVVYGRWMLLSVGECSSFVVRCNLQCGKASPNNIVSHPPFLR